MIDRHGFVFVLLLILLAPAPASADAPSLMTRFQVGDRFQLSIRSQTETEASSRGARRESEGEAVVLEYEATVVVTEVDVHGWPLREKHLDAQLTYHRPDGSGSLFRERTALEIRHAAVGSEVFVGDRRAPAPVERVVNEMLRVRHDRAEFCQWLEPGRAVAAGDIWELDPIEARRFLAERGIQVMHFDGPPTAELEERAGTRSVRYRIPVRGVELTDMPAGSRVSRGRAMLEGSVVLPSGDGLAAEIAHSSSFQLDLEGRVGTKAPSVTWGSMEVATRNPAPAARWQLDRSQSIEQRIVVLERVADTRSPGAP